MAEHEQPLGLVVATHGRHFDVEMPDGNLRKCFPRGKKAGPAVGDFAYVQAQGNDEGVITGLAPRRNLLYRSDAMRSKQFAANLDLLLYVIAAIPAFSEDLLGRALVAAHSADIEPLIVLNKADLPETDGAWRRLAGIVPEGVAIIKVQALDRHDVASQLAPRLSGRCSLLLGQSGMGKSTLLNTLVPDAHAATRSHSEALGAGRHTTTGTRLYHLPDGGSLIDSPGFQNFGLHHLSAEDIAQGFPEFRSAIEHCRYYNCSHRHEPGCGVLAALAERKISPARHALYERLLNEHELAVPYR